MKHENKNIEQLLKEVAQLKIENSVLRELESKHKEIKETLDQERSLYLDLANAFPSGMYRLRVFASHYTKQEKWMSSKDAPYILEFVNNRFCEILNLSREDYEHNPAIINDLIFEDDKTEFAKRNVEANINRIPFLWEGCMIVKGEKLWVHFESLPRLLDNGDILWTGILYDINNRKNFEQEIKRKNEELNKINIEKDRILSIIGHDLKTPFNAIIGFCDLLSEKIKLNDYKQIERYADIISNSSQRAMDLLRSLIQWSQSQTDKKNFNPENFEMTDTIDEVLLLLKDIAEHKSISVTKRAPAQIPIFADKIMISTIIRNLVSNAIKFTPFGGSICIHAYPTSDTIVMSVSDTGVGIKRMNIQLLFKIGSNITTQGTNNEQGTGMGLILCKEFIDRHDGKIWVESEEGNGTTITVTIPNNKNKE